MHQFLLAAGVLIFVMIIVHIFFKVVKFTLGVLFLGLTLIATVYVFQVYFGIDLVAVIFGHV